MRFAYRFFTFGILLTSVFMSVLQHPASAFKDTYEGLELNIRDNLAIKSIIKNEPDGIFQEFVYIVQVEDEQGYVVFISFQDGALAQNGEQELTINWSVEKKGTFAIRSFVWSGFDHPVPQISLTQESRIAVNGEDRIECSGSSACITGIVTKVVDGDTLDVGDIRIRLAIVNTPEIGEAGYAEATTFTSTICPVGSHVLVDEDDGQPDGSFGRMIAKVTCGDNKILNAELLSSGYASILTEFCDVSEFATEDWIQGHGCVDEPKQLIPNANPPPPAKETSCDPSYPNVCIPPLPPDLDCGDISYKNFKVLAPDPHRFDGNKDGVGCES